MSTMKDKFYGVGSPLVDYVKTNMETFETDELNEVDALVFALLSYLRLEKYVPEFESVDQWVKIRTLYRLEEFEQLTDKNNFQEPDKELLCWVCASPRFRDIEINFHTDKYNVEKQEQFSATTFRLPKGEIVLGFRGTDSTIIGWKEDFNMTFLFPVPSQKSALKYVERVAELTGDEPIYLVGHSKGGSLASYGYAFASREIKDRVKLVYNLDGPGFPKDIGSDTDFIKDEAKIIKIMPEGSIVGVLLENINNVTVIKSYHISMLQHFPYSWNIVGKEFVRCDNPTLSVTTAEKTINQWVYQWEPEKRKTFIETIFEVISSIDAEHITELIPQLVKNRNNALETLKNIDDETAECIKEIMNNLVQLSINTIADEGIRKIKMNRFRPQALMRLNSNNNSTPLLSNEKQD